MARAWCECSAGLIVLDAGRRHPLCDANLSREHRRRERMREPILVKRYAGSRLYDTSKARYVTIEELREWRNRGIALEVREAETGEDVSRILLT